MHCCALRADAGPGVPVPRCVLKQASSWGGFEAVLIVLCSRLHPKITI